MSKLRTDQLETLDSLHTKNVADLVDDINEAHVTTSTGEQMLVEALDDRKNKSLTEVHIDEFGVDRTGSTDESQALSDAIDAAIARGFNVVNMGDSGSIKIELEKTVSGIELRGRAELVGGDTKCLHLIGDGNIVRGLTFRDTNRNSETLWLNGEDSHAINVKAYNGTKSTATTAVYGDLIRISGNQSSAIFCEAWNGHTGIKLDGGDSPSSRVYNQKILHCYSHDNIRGCVVKPEVSEALIQGNDFVYNDVNNEPASDGLLCERNVSGLRIVDNNLSHNGEHGLYFQGDNSIVANNHSIGNAGSGLKFGGKKEGNFDTVDADYVSRNVTVADNLCRENGIGTSNSGIYLQETHSGYLLSDNVCESNQAGIIAANQQLGGEIHYLTITGGRSVGNTNSDLRVSVTRGLHVQGGVYGIIGSFMPDRVFEDATLDGVVCQELVTADIVHLKLKNVEIKSFFTPSSATTVDIYGGTIHQDGDFDFSRIRDAVDVNIIFDVAGSIVAAATSKLRRFSGSIDASNNGTTRAFNISSAQAPTGTAIGPLRITGISTRNMTLNGNHHSVNQVITDTEGTSDIIEVAGSGCMIMGCTSTASATARVTMNSASDNCIAVGNQATVVDVGTSNIRAANRAEP